VPAERHAKARHKEPHLLQAPHGLLDQRPLRVVYVKGHAHGRERREDVTGRVLQSVRQRRVLPTTDGEQAGKPPQNAGQLT